MKNSSLIFNIVLSIAVAILYYLHFSSKGGNTAATVTENGVVTTGKMPEKSASIVFVNSDTLWGNYEMVKDTKAKMDAERSSKETQFSAKYQALEAEAASFKEIAPRLSQEEGQRQQMELMQKEQKLMETKELMTQELMTSEQQKNEMLQKNIADYIKRLNATSKYNYVLGYSFGGGILYANDSLDVTKDVLAGLNKEYRETKGKK